MKEKKYYIVFNGFEQRIIVHCLNEMRNQLIREGRYTDAVDELIIKICDAKIKKFKIE